MGPVVYVERLPEPRRITDLHEIVWSTVYGYLHIGDQQIILDSKEEVDALEAIIETAHAALSYRVLLPQGEHMAFSPGSKTRALAVAIDTMNNIAQVTIEPPHRMTKGPAIL